MDKEIFDLFDCNGIKIKAHRFAVYLPSKLSDEKRIDPKRYKVLCRMTEEFLCRELGGATIYRAVGMWVNDPKDPKSVENPHREMVRVAESYCGKDVLREKAGRVRQFVNALAIEFEQVAMSCVIDGEMAFFEPEDEYRKIHAKIGEKPRKARDEYVRVTVESKIREMKAREKGLGKNDLEKKELEIRAGGLIPNFVFNYLEDNKIPFLSKKP